MSDMGSVKFVYVNYDKHSDVRSSLRVRSVPMFFILKIETAKLFNWR